ncbi:MAG TPA: Coenzyme F420 hydrogenase/dehydrogenase, beta subunit C-terminal domain [Spirochaetales bacterium]|nr:Coenzyme F420 hydrogenase/dehydrogenase, beta subunit C-terminal domain [Spirochaetales bacterium]
MPSPALWKKYIAYHEAQSGSRIVRTSSRRKDFGWKRYSLSFSFANGSEYLKTLDKDPYMQMFLRNLCLRPSCYECSFKTISRISDITLADFWNVEHVLPDLDDDTGTSLVFVHSSKGKDMISSVSDAIESVPVCIESVIPFNSAIIKSAELPAKRKRFFTDMQNIPFSKFIKVYSKDEFYIRLYTFVRRSIGKIKHKVMGK